MTVDSLQMLSKNTEVSFYTRDSYFSSLIGQWTRGCGVSLKLFKNESSLLQQLSRNRPQVVILGVDRSLLREGFVSCIASAAHRPTIVSLIKTSNKSELAECYAQGADRVYSVPNCTATIFQALLGRLTRKEQYFTPYLINHSIQTIKFGEVEVRLTKKPFDVALYLFINHGKLLTKSKILFDLWGMDNKQCVTDRVAVHVSQVRRQLELDGTHDWEIRARRHLGYGIFSSSCKNG